MYTCTVDTPLGAMLASRVAVFILQPVAEPVEATITTVFFVGTATSTGSVAVSTSAEHLASKGRDALTGGCGSKGSVFCLTRPAGSTRLICRCSASCAPGSKRISRGKNLTLRPSCHRVIGTNGSLTGYAGGIERKKALLALERQARIDVAANIG